MNFLYSFPLFLIVLSLISAVLCSLLPKKASLFVSLCLYALSFCANAVLFFVLSGKSVTYMMGHYPHPYGNEIRLSRLEALFSAAFSFVLFLSVLGGREMTDRRIEDGKEHYYYVMTNLVQSALLVLVYTNDIFTGYVFIEICTLSGCGILMIRQNGKTILASVRYMIFSLIGSGLFLFGVIFLYNITGHLLMPDLKEAIAKLNASGEYRLPLLTAICLICLGIGIKSGLCPFHLWMADTYGAAIPTSSAILSGLISKGYIFFLIKLIFDVFGTDVFYASGIQNVVFMLGAVGIIIGSVSAIREDNILRMTAYSSASQIGYIYMGIGLSPTLGMEAALFHILAHALTKPAIFLSAGRLSDNAGGLKKFKNLRGAGFLDPLSGVVFTFGAFSMIGLPLTMGFISKYLFGVAAFENAHNKMIPALLALAVSTILNTLYFARAVLYLYDKRSVRKTDAPAVLSKRAGFLIASVCLILCNLFLGIFARPFIDLLANAMTLF